MATCPSDKMEHAPPTVLYDRPGAGFWQSLQQWQVEAKERIEAAGDFRGGGFRWDKAHKRLGVGWTPACKIPDAKVHIQGDGLPVTRPLALRVDGKSGADSSNPRGEVFFGDIANSTYTDDPVFYEVCVPAAASRRQRGVRIDGGALTDIAGGQLIFFTVNNPALQFNTGTLLSGHTSMYFNGQSISATSAKTLSSASTLNIQPPTAGTNVTIGTGANYFTGPFALVTGPSHFFNTDNTTGPSGAKTPPAAISFCRPPLTALSSGYAFREFSANVGNGIQWSGAGPTTFLSFVLNDASTPLSCTAPTTITNAVSVYIADAPSASTNVTITNRWALWVDAGNVRIDDNLTVGGTTTLSAMTAGRVVYTGTGGLLSSSADLQWDATGKRLGIGTSSPSWPLHVIGTAAASEVASYQNLSTTGTTGHLMYDSGGTFRTAWGYANASFAVAARAGKAFMFINGVDLTVTDDTTHFIYVDRANARVGITAGTSLDAAAMDVRGTQSDTIIIRGTTASTQGSLLVKDSSNTNRVTFGYGNSSFATTARRRGFIGLFNSTDFTFTDDTTHFIYIDQANKRIGFNAGTAPGYAVHLKQSTATSVQPGFAAENSDSAGEAGIAMINNTGEVSRLVVFGSTAAAPFGNNVYLIKQNTRAFTFRRAGTADDATWAGDGTWGFTGINDTSVAGSAATTDATVTTCGSFTPGVSRTVYVYTHFVAFNSAGATGASYIRYATFRVNGAGTVTQIGATRTLGTDNEDVAGWDATIDTSGGVIRNRVTGAAATNINWKAYTLVRNAT